MLIGSATTFSEGLWRSKKIIPKFKLNDKAIPVFKPKRNVPFSALEAVNKELERLEKIGVISKINYSEWISP